MNVCYKVILLFGTTILLTGCSQSISSDENSSLMRRTDTDCIASSVPTITENLLSDECQGDNASFCIDEGYETFDNYATFAERVKIDHPDWYLYIPPNDQDFIIDEITIWDKAFYHVYVTFDDGTKAVIEVLPRPYFSNIEELKKHFGGSINIEGNSFDIADPLYLFEHYSDGLITMIGLTSDMKVTFMLMNVSENKPKNPADQEQTLIDMYSRLGL